MLHYMGHHTYVYGCSASGGHSRPGQFDFVLGLISVVHRGLPCPALLHVLAFGVVSLHDLHS